MSQSKATVRTDSTNEALLRLEAIDRLAGHITAGYDGLHPAVLAEGIVELARSAADFLTGEQR